MLSLVVEMDLLPSRRQDCPIAAPLSQCRRMAGVCGLRTALKKKSIFFPGSHIIIGFQREEPQEETRV
jgi:hypothetical protein